MGYSTVTVPFTDDRLKIDADEATNINHLKPITLRQFAGSERVRVEKVTNQPVFIFTKLNGDFVKGKQIISTS